MTQKALIRKYLESLNGEWVLAGKIRSIKTDWGNIGFRGDRDLRDMYETPQECEKWGIEVAWRGKFRIVRARIALKIRYEITANFAPINLSISHDAPFNAILPPAFKETKKVEAQSKLF